MFSETHILSHLMVRAEKEEGKEEEIQFFTP